MTVENRQIDLVILVADKDMEAAVEGVINRPKSLQIRPVNNVIYRHPEKDCGCRTDGITFLRQFRAQSTHALIMFDREGCGRESQSAEVIEEEIEASLRLQWGENGAAIVLDPELEIWVWSSSPYVERILGWSDRSIHLRDWLIQNGYVSSTSVKPTRPKEVLEQALRIVRKPRSSSIFHELAKKVGLARCEDRSFVKLKDTLLRWFGSSNSVPE